MVARLAGDLKLGGDLIFRAYAASAGTVLSVDRG